MKTINIQCQIKVNQNVPFVKQKNQIIESDLLTTLTLMSPEVKGAIALSFKHDVFLALIRKMLGSPDLPLSIDIQDGASELLNMIFGHAKVILNDTKGFAFEKSVPTMSRGQNPQFESDLPSPIYVLPFKSEAGPFALEVTAIGRT